MSRRTADLLRLIDKAASTARPAAVPTPAPDRTTACASPAAPTPATPALTPLKGVFK